MKLAESLYVYEWTNYFENNCNSFFIGGTVGALVDPGLSKHLPDLLKRMAKDGIKKEDIKYVVNTHSHPDHYEASALFDSSQVKIALSEIEMEFMKGPGAYLYQLFGLNAPVGRCEPPPERRGTEAGRRDLRDLHRARPLAGLYRAVLAGKEGPVPG